MSQTIVGLGVDLVEVGRMVTSASADSTLAKRILTTSELAELARRYEKSVHRAACYMATRFAAKEAFAKAFGTGIGAELSFQDLSILHHESGAPYFAYSEKLHDRMAKLGFSALVSMSDEKHYATATVIIQRSTAS